MHLGKLIVFEAIAIHIARMPVATVFSQPMPWKFDMNDNAKDS